MVEKHSRILNPVLHWLDIENDIKICKQILGTFFKMLGFSFKPVRLLIKHLRNEEQFEKQQYEINELIGLNKQGYLVLYFGEEKYFGDSLNINGFH